MQFVVCDKGCCRWRYSCLISWWQGHFCMRWVKESNKGDLPSKWWHLWSILSCHWITSSRKTLLFYLIRDCIRSEKMDLLLAICREEEKSQSVDNQLFLSSSFALVSTEYEEIVIMIVEKGNLNWWQLEIARKIIYGIACISWINVARPWWWCNPLWRWLWLSWWL